MDNKPKTSAADFFLHLGVIATLYATVSFLLNLLFTVINVAYPQVDLYYLPSISFPVAALIILFPIFLLLSWLVQKSYTADPAKKQLGIRKWLTYLTLFITGVVIAGDLITVVYYFLDGRDFTTGFILKFLAVLVVAVKVFWYYLRDLQDRVTSNQRNRWLYCAVGLVLISIVLGFAVIGSPKTQRLIRYDNQKLSDLQNIQGQIINYWQQKGSLPSDLKALNDSISYAVIPADPQTGAQYEYSVSGQTSFTLCADFNKAYTSQPYTTSINYPGKENENWKHDAGHACFQRTIDPELYPVMKR